MVGFMDNVKKVENYMRGYCIFYIFVVVNRISIVWQIWMNFLIR